MKTLLITCALLACTTFAHAQDGPTEDCAESTDQFIRAHELLDNEMRAVKRTGEIHYEVLRFASDELVFWLSEGYVRCHNQDVGAYQITPIHLFDAFEFQLWLHDALSGCETIRDCDAYWR